MKIFNASSFSELLEKWLQWMTLFVYMSFLVTSVSVGWIVWALLVIYFPLLRYPLLFYAAWIYYDRKTPALGTRKNDWIRSWKFWKYHNDFFPSKLHKIVDLPSDKNYLFCSFPHGILCSGAFSVFGTSYGGFSKCFPKLKNYATTLEQHFNTPFFRDYIMAMGAVPASASCLTSIFEKDKGNAVVLVVGGAQEAFYSRRGKYEVNLKKRKGFVKVALKTGTSLVPVITFGETDLYEQVIFKENSFLDKLQAFLKKVLGIAPVIFYGQFGVVPFRKPLNVVVGKPIDVKKVEQPTDEEIDKVHSKFVDALQNLFESEKHKYIENAGKTHLVVR